MKTVQGKARTKSRKAQSEQMFSASPPTGDIKTDAAALRVKVETMGYLTGQLMSGMVSAGSSTVMTLPSRPDDLAVVALRDLADPIGAGVGSCCAGGEDQSPRDTVSPT